MKTYTYDEKTKEFKSEQDALLDPLETQKQGKSVYLLPGNSTYTAPTHQESCVPVWNGSAWEQVEDHRKDKYWLPDDKYGTPGREIKELGPLPEGATLTAPERTLEDYKSLALSNQYQKYEKQKHAIAWLTDGSGYGFDTEQEDQNNWQVALTLMDNDKTMYKVYTDKNNLSAKAFLEVTRSQMMEAGKICKAQQYAAYSGFEQVKAKIEDAAFKEALKPYLPEEMA